MRTTMTLAAFCIAASMVEAQTGTIVVFEGARVIVGDDSVIEDAVLIVEDGKIQNVGPSGSVSPPGGATHVSLEGKTVMPLLVDLHGHVGFLKEGVFAAENYGAENIIEQLRILEYCRSWRLFEPGHRPRAGRVESSRRAACRKHRRRPSPRSRTGVRRAGRRTSRFPARARAVRGRSARARPPPRSGQRRSRRGHDQTLGG